MTRDEIIIALNDSLEDIFDVSGDSAKSEMLKKGDFLFEDFADSSILLTELCLQMEEKLDVEMELTDLNDAGSYQKFIDFLCREAGA